MHGFASAGFSGIMNHVHKRNRPILSSAVAEWSSSVACRAHNPKVAGSNPASATMDGSRSGHPRRFAKPVWAYSPSRVRIPPHPLAPPRNPILP